MIKVYIASPYTMGDTAINVKRQLDCVNELMDLGFAPFAPLYSHFQHMAHPRPYQDWLAVDMIWVLSCDCLLRLSGVSNGADLEVKHALEYNIPVFYSMEELLKWREEIITNKKLENHPRFNIENFIDFDTRADLKKGDVFLWRSQTTGKYEIHMFHSDAGYGMKTFTDYNEIDGSSTLVNYSGFCGILTGKDS